MKRTRRRRAPSLRVLFAFGWSCDLSSIPSGSSLDDVPSTNAVATRRWQPYGCPMPWKSSPTVLRAESALSFSHNIAHRRTSICSLRALVQALHRRCSDGRNPHRRPPMAMPCWHWARARLSILFDCNDKPGVSGWTVEKNGVHGGTEQTATQHRAVRPTYSCASRAEAAWRGGAVSSLVIASFGQAQG